MVNITDEIFASRLTILRDLFADSISAPTAANKLAEATLSDDTTLEGSLGRLWNLVLTLACENPEHQDKLVDVLVDLSELPSPDAEQGSGPLTIHEMEVWKDLPMLGWSLRDYYNISVNPNKSAEEQQKAISQIINISKFAALLTATDEDIFASNSWFALITLRAALESPTERRPGAEPLEAWIPAAAAWIETLGVEIYNWDEEFESGPKIGARGKGGPLWDGKHGFCKGRWKLWRERFGEIARTEGELGEDVKKTAEDAETMMKEIEAGDVE
ncbi:hypothetical protein ASPVEDRAFT_161509 [Aspergillus versicolor CBS 583.65]|uniref:Uncharacterized protein n=1 Tax=Aspergillus versicolor CBS 583.65 TaxID=1036611 RepID=A0A1L9P9Y7_ASPVE|nr:uncharacterized protein ASPVEDRAFT_161509 [Aspergillus versicolor CBS 583.65]OJI98347.1 hypothetical protein ASPVEDRAFT_161509 [Aspergillus versicolor CBS 583.65]